VPDRLAGVLAVVYLVFNEGYAASAGDRLVRAELCAEAIRLGRLLVQLMPDDAETAGLLALMLIHGARREARVGGDGRYVALPDQDRARWDLEALAEGRAQLERALRLRRTGPYQLQAAIASLHCEDEVDWPQIAALYRLLACMAPSPVVEVNRAVALGMAGSPDAGLAVLDRLELDRYQPFHVAHAELLRRSGDEAAADGAYARAIELSANAVERAELERRRASRPRPSASA
jgi:RNA polymerase sigma-70 factor (ECF subfamily)